MVVLALRIPPALSEAIRREAERVGLTPSELCRRHLEARFSLAREVCDGNENRSKLQRAAGQETPE